jgi:hypothetical protein
VRPAAARQPANVRIAANTEQGVPVGVVPKNGLTHAQLVEAAEGLKKIYRAVRRMPLPRDFSDQR